MFIFKVHLSNIFGKDSFVYLLKTDPHLHMHTPVTISHLLSIEPVHDVFFLEIYIQIILFPSTVLSSTPW